MKLLSHFRKLLLCIITFSILTGIDAIASGRIHPIEIDSIEYVYAMQNADNLNIKNFWLPKRSKALEEILETDSEAKFIYETANETPGMFIYISLTVQYPQKRISLLEFASPIHDFFTYLLIKRLARSRMEIIIRS